MATMITTVSAPSPSHVSNLRLQNRYRLLPTITSPSRHLPMNNIYQYKSSFLTNQISPVSFTKAAVFWKLYASMDSNTPPPAPSNVPKPNLPSCIRCIVGVIVSLMQPFWKIGAEAKLLALGRQIEDTVEMVEDVAGMVVDVAEAVDKASSELVKKLPEDGFLKEAVTFVGNISKEVADDAEDAIEFIDKVEKVKAELESIVEDVIEGNWDAKEGEGAQEKVKDVQMKVEATVEVTSEEETKETGKNGIDRAGLVRQATTEMTININ